MALQLGKKPMGGISQSVKLASKFFIFAALEDVSFSALVGKFCLNRQTRLIKLVR
jgi:hypothetical protein